MLTMSAHHVLTAAIAATTVGAAKRKCEGIEESDNSLSSDHQDETGR